VTDIATAAGSTGETVQNGISCQVGAIVRNAATVIGEDQAAIGKRHDWQS
jgi:hypothetical protein